jgi:sec-independent protein translocase protein TatA
MGALKGWHIVVLLVVVLLLFGAPKLPELARSIGKSLHILKDEAKSLTSDDDAAPTTQSKNDAANHSTTDVTGDTEARDK